MQIQYTSNNYIKKICNVTNCMYPDLKPVARPLTNLPILEWCDTILKNSTQCGLSGWLLGSSVPAH